MPINRRPGEKKDEFIERCVAKEIEGGMKSDQAVAVCSSIWEDKQLSAIKRMRSQGEDKWIVDFFKSNKLGTPIEELGITQEQLDDTKYHFEVDVDVKKFALGRSESDIEDVEISLYKYVGPISSNSREFCRTLISEGDGRVFTMEDIVALNTAPKKGKFQRALRAGGGDYSIFKYRGGNNCKHIWVRYKYNTEKGELVESFIQPKQQNMDV